MFPHRPLAAALLGLAIGSASLAVAHEGGEDRNHNRVLLISIDGMHALDFQNCVAAGHLSRTWPPWRDSGVNYTRTSTSKPSDSFPGLMALVTGGTPKLVGAYYDVAYDRVLAPPAADTGNGVLHGECVPGVAERHAHRVRGRQRHRPDAAQRRLPAYGTFDGGIKSIDPAQADPRSVQRLRAGLSVEFHPRQYDLRRHPSRRRLHGLVRQARGLRGGVGTHRHGSAEQRRRLLFARRSTPTSIPLPGVKTATGLDCSTIRTTTAATGPRTFDNIKCYDQLKVNAVLNWIGGQHSPGRTQRPAVPQIFGMNFQAVSVGQKLIENGVHGRLHRCRRHADRRDARARSTSSTPRSGSS